MADNDMNENDFSIKIGFDRWSNIIKARIQQGIDVEINVIGISMYPTLKNGTKVIVKRANVDEIKVGDIAVYKHWKNNFTIHRIISVINENGKVLFQTKGDHNSYIDEYLIAEEEILGVVEMPDSEVKQ